MSTAVTPVPLVFGDYALEDRVIAAMGDLAARFAPPPGWPAPIHVYAHPKAPAAGPDPKGR